MWFKDEECKEVIRLRWTKNKNDSKKTIVRTLQNLGKDLTKWKKTKFGNVERCIHETRAKI